MSREVGRWGDPEGWTQTLGLPSKALSQCGPPISLRAASPARVGDAAQVAVAVAISIGCALGSSDKVIVQQHYHHHLQHDDHACRCWISTRAMSC